MYYLDVPLTREGKAFYRRPETNDVRNYADLGDRRIAVLRGSVYFPKFDADNGLNKYPVGDYATALRMLVRGRVELAIMPELLGDYDIAKGKLPVVKSTYVTRGRPSYITVSKKSPIFSRRQELEKLLVTMRSGGTVDEIVNRYK